MDELKQFTHQFRSERGSPFTHTSIGKPAYSINIPNEKLDDFYNVYKRAMQAGGSLHLTEKPTNPSMMRADFDFRFALPDGLKPGEPLPRMYIDADIQRILVAYFEVLSSALAAPDDAFIAYVMEKKHPVEYRGKLKDGIHIVWPQLIVNNDLQHWVRRKVLDRSPLVFTGLPLTNSFDDVVDDHIIDKCNWQMYGSSKPDMEAYKVTQIWKWDPQDRSLIDMSALVGKVSEAHYVSMFSMRAFTEPTEVFADKAEEIEQYVRHVMPATEERRKNKLHQQIFAKSINYMRNQAPEEEFKLAKDLVLQCLNRSRADNYDQWIKLGWVLRNCDFRLLQTWIEFSKFSSKFIGGECEKLWDSMRVDTLGMGTLRWWAKKDNLARYNEILSDNVITLIDRCAGSEGAHFDVATVVHSLYKDTYRFTTKDIWYTFNPQKHRWVRTKEGLYLRLLLSIEICSKFIARALHFNTEAMRFPEHRDVYEDKAKKLQAIALKLKSCGYKDSIMKECKALFTDEKFEELLDSHAHLIGFENGVYDLRMHEFREGLPDDYISFSTGRHYIPYDPKSIEAQEVEGFFEKLFTNANVRRYVKDVLTIVLDGSIRQEKFYMFTGSGCHAIDTPILMHDGSLRKVQDIVEGDTLMGDDHTPRVVQQLFRGTDHMFDIIPREAAGESFRVNANHVLCVKFSDKVSVTRDNANCVRWFEPAPCKTDEPIQMSKTFASTEEAAAFARCLPAHAVHAGDVLDITVKDLLRWDSWWLREGAVVLYKSEAVPFQHQNLEIDPYTYGFEIKSGRFANDPIPHVYKTASLEQRRELLAGILDAHGHASKTHPSNKYVLTLTNATLAEDVLYLARSLGMACTATPAASATITLEIRNQASTTSSFTIQECEAGNYYGFELDGNHRYVMGDFTVTHNSNGKSKLLELVQKAIGEYYCILPISLLTQKRVASNAAQSELERTKGRRFAVMQEPGDAEKLNIGLMKELSGGDRILARGLFKDPVEFRPQFKMIMTCNELPEVSSDDGGTWRRIRVMEFTSKFTDSPDPSKPSEFPIDLELSEKFDRWAETFISMLIEHHKQLNPTTVEEPMEVRCATEGYKKNNDIIGQFVSENIVRDATVTTRVMVNNLFIDFKNWAIKVGYKGKKLPDRNQFKAYMEKTFGQYPVSGWRGLRVISATQDDEDDDAPPPPAGGA